jgi:glyoxylase-like metal-dependent hydrolase (beta-lactamase superfamily II)
MDDPQPPVDPRTAWALPAPGALPCDMRVHELAWRIVAPNPSPMTLDGTNTYLVGAGSGRMVIVDPGPDDERHQARVRGRVDALDAEVCAIVVTHRHLDHAAAALPWSRRFGCPLLAGDATLVSEAGARGRVLADGDRIDLGGASAEVVATPGHSPDHLALRLPTGALLVGDHVLGRGTSVIAWPDGSLGDYLESLRRVRRLGAHALLPGHGPVLDRDPDAVVDYYLAHRTHRLAQILAVLADGPTDVDGLVAALYRGLDGSLRPAAVASTRAAVDHLVATGLVEATVAGVLRTVGSEGSLQP